jgi:long-chain acyl-CoA synthetase
MPAKKQDSATYWPPDIPKTISYPIVPLQDILRKKSQIYPNRPAVTYSGVSISYGELDSLSDHFASGLSAIGIRKGDRVALFLPNIPQFIVAFYGVLKIGAIVTAISPLHKEREVQNQLSDSEAETIVALESLYPLLESVWSKTKLRHAIITHQDEFSTDPAALAGNIALKPFCLRFSQLLMEDALSLTKVNIDPEEDLAALQYTGGTTGTAKGAMLTHMNLVSNALMFATWIGGVEAEETFLTALPLFHIYGLTTSLTVPVSLAATMVLVPKFDSTTVLESIQRNKITVFCGVPTMYSALLANSSINNYDLTSLKMCISGASPLPSKVQEEFMAVTHGLLAEGYGLTEASPVTHCNPADNTVKTVRVGSIGLPLPDTEAMIVDAETGEKPLLSGETGELVVKGPQVMKGYWRKPEETANVIRNGWLYTGDIGKTDSDGYFYITDRKKDLIKYRDYSVYPREIEDVLYEHPAVRLCAVIGKPAADVGEVPKAFVVLKQGSMATEAELLDFVKPKIAPYKMPRQIEFRKELPNSPAGKVLKRLLRDEERARV